MEKRTCHMSLHWLFCCEAFCQLKLWRTSFTLFMIGTYINVHGTSLHFLRSCTWTQKIPCKLQYSEKDKNISILSINTVDNTAYIGFVSPNKLNECHRLTGSAYVLDCFYFPVYFTVLSLLWFSQPLWSLFTTALWHCN